MRPFVAFSFFASSRLILLRVLSLLLPLLRWLLLPLSLPEFGRDPEPGRGSGMPEGATATFEGSTTRRPPLPPPPLPALTP